MSQAKMRPESSTGHRALGTGVARAFAIAAQMAMLGPANTDEFMRRELESAEGSRRRSAAAGR